MNAPVTIEKRKPLTRREVIQLIEYCSDTGAFRWLARSEAHCGWNIKHAGKPAFTGVNAAGYLTGRLNGHRYVAHHVAWLLAYGKWPGGMLDHIDGNRKNNRIANLRLATSALNARNAKQRSDNTSGITGVHWDKQHRKWRAHIHYDGRLIHLGLFHDLPAAAAARAAANVLYGFSDRHGAANG